MTHISVFFGHGSCALWHGCIHTFYGLYAGEHEPCPRLPFGACLDSRLSNELDYGVKHTEVPAGAPSVRTSLLSSMPLSIWFSSSSVKSQWCSLQLSPVSLLRMTSSLSVPLRAAKWGISTITGLTGETRYSRIEVNWHVFGKSLTEITVVKTMQNLLQ